MPALSADSGWRCAGSPSCLDRRGRRECRWSALSWRRGCRRRNRRGRRAREGRRRGREGNDDEGAREREQTEGLRLARPGSGREIGGAERVSRGDGRCWSGAEPRGSRDTGADCRDGLALRWARRPWTMITQPSRVRLSAVWHRPGRYWTEETQRLLGDERSAAPGQKGVSGVADKWWQGTGAGLPRTASPAAGQPLAPLQRYLPTRKCVTLLHTLIGPVRYVMSVASDRACSML